MKPTEKQIKEIAEDLDCGFRCFFNLKTGEVKSIPHSDDGFFDDEEFVQKELEGIEEAGDNYFEFRKLDSSSSYEVMTDFANSIDDSDFQNRLMRALNRPKPFRNFKREIDNSGDYRQLWFDFKREADIWYVEWQIKKFL